MRRLRDDHYESLRGNDTSNIFSDQITQSSYHNIRLEQDRCQQRIDESKMWMASIVCIYKNIVVSIRYLLGSKNLNASE